MGAQWKAKGKELAANARGRVFGKLAKEIMVAARGGADPAGNAKLNGLPIRSIVVVEGSTQVAALDARPAGRIRNAPRIGMKYLLDTNVCVEALRQRNQNIAHRLATTSLSDKYLCPIVQAELYFGAYKSRNPANLSQVQVFIAHFQALPFDGAAAQKYGELRADLQRFADLPPQSRGAALSQPIERHPLARKAHE